MVWELHVWGPAFSLPSIDAQCLATIAYFTQAVPKGQWVLVASGDPSLSPTKDLPALRDGSTWIGGFRNILDYVRQYSDGEWDLDGDLEGREKSDSIAFSSFVEAHGQPLLDLSLYVSSQNYTSATRPAYSSILSWPAQWIVPPDRRAAAKLRTRHLGLSSLDVDTPSSDNASSKSKTGTTPGSDQIPPSLRTRPRETPTSLLSAPQAASNIRLHALTDTFLRPLQDLLGTKRYFFSSSDRRKAGSLDCLTFGYLALALYPDLPQPWLADILRDRYGRLCGYVHDLRASFFGGPVSVQDALLDAAAVTTEQDRRSERHILPFVAPSTGSLLDISALLLTNVLDSVPVLSQLRASNRLTRAATDDDGGDDGNDMSGSERAQLLAIATARRKELVAQILTVGAGVGAFVGYLFYTGIVALPTFEGQGQGEAALQGRRNLGDMGEAGAMLAMAGHVDGNPGGNESERHG